MRITLRIESEKHAGLCTDYWERNKRGQFDNSLEELSERHNVARKEISRIVQANCTAEAVDWECQRCHSLFNFALSTRTDVSNLRLDVKGRFCDSCEVQRASEHQKLRDMLFELGNRAVQESKPDVNNAAEERRHMRIEVEHLTDKHFELCEQFWELDGCTFRYKVYELAEKHGVTPPSVPGLIKQHCNGHLRGLLCPTCGKEHGFDVQVRGDFLKHSLQSELVNCPECWGTYAAEREAQTRKRDAEFDAFIDGKQDLDPQHAPSREQGAPKTNSTATVQIKTGTCEHYYRFVNLTGSEIRLTPLPSSDSGRTEGEVVLKGSVVSGDFMQPGGPDEKHYLVSVGQDGSFCIDRVRPQLIGAGTRRVLVEDEHVISGQSIKQELEYALLDAIREDFFTVPEMEEEDY
jgi:hypothetical protein